MTRGAKVGAAIVALCLAILYATRDPAEHLRADAEYCERVAYRVHDNFRRVDCEAVMHAVIEATQQAEEVQP